MGIEDFNVESADYVDHVLIISASAAKRTSIASVLAKRRCRCTLADSIIEAEDLKAGLLFDLVVCDLDSEDSSVDQALQSLRMLAAAHSSPMLIIHPRPQTLDLEQNDALAVLPSPYEPAQLIVKASTLLRMRKGSRRGEKPRHETDSAALNAQLRELTNRFKRDLREARDIQQSLLPKTLPADQHTAFAAAYLPLEALGGDLYDVWEISPGLYGTLIADVTGHGLPAALLGAMTKMALSLCEYSSPDEILASINDNIAAFMPDGRFVTMAIAIYESMTGKLRFGRAGHPAAYLWRRDNAELEMLSPAGLPLGLMKGSRFRLAETIMHAGDSLLMVTDGITESSNEQHQMAGPQTTGEWFSAAAQKNNLRSGLEYLLQKHRDFIGSTPINDDITLVSLQRI